MSGSRRRKKQFDCGCRGYGKFCHRCRDIAEGRLVQKDGKWMSTKRVAE